MRDGVLEIRIPGRSTQTEEREFVEYFRDRFERERSATVTDLTDRAEQLARSYELATPDEIKWVGNQKSRWGSCTPADKTIRLSNRMARFPTWVIDYVIVHELAHLTEPNHDAAFWSLVNRYPLTERARGYLMAKSEG